MILRLPLAPTGAEAQWRDKAHAERTTIKLDSVYSQVRAGDRAALEVDGVLAPVTVSSVTRSSVAVTNTATMPVTLVTFSPAVICSDGQSLIFHADPFRIGAPTRPAETEISLADVAAGGALEAPVPPLGKAPAGGEVILVGARERGLLASGRVNVREDGAGRFDLSLGSQAEAGTLAAPISLFGNVVEAIGAKPWSRKCSVPPTPRRRSTFPSAQAAAGLARGQRPAERPPARARGPRRRRRMAPGRNASSGAARTSASMSSASSRTAAAGSFSATDGAAPGLRRGVDNIRAGYRQGAGAAKPPPGSISQLKGSVKGLARRARAARRCTEAPILKAPRRCAPPRRLARLPSDAPSRSPISRRWRAASGRSTPQPAEIWDEGRQRAVVKLWIISGGAGLSERLAPWLAGQAVPDLAIMVEEAGAVQPALAIALDVQPGHQAGSVRAEAHAALFDAESGLLSPARQTIGAPLFRSVLVHRLQRSRASAR